MKRAVVATLWLVLICTPAAAQEHNPQMVVDRFMRAWDAADPKAISGLFTDEADLIAPDGAFAKGRLAVEAYYATAFANGYAGSKGMGEIIQQRELSHDLILLDSRFSIVGAHKMDGSLKADEKGAMAVVLRRAGDDWRIVALRERSGSDFAPFPPVH
jgi:uncharacterized protein (TIGR02246 family)